MDLKMSDIAKMAGVSKAAVSFALNGKPGVSDETRKKIFKVIKDQGYEPLRKHKKGGVRKIASISLIIIQDRTGMMNRSYASLPFFVLWCLNFHRMSVELAGRCRLLI